MTETKKQYKAPKENLQVPIETPPVIGDLISLFEQPKVVDAKGDPVNPGDAVAYVNVDINGTPSLMFGVVKKVSEDFLSILTLPEGSETVKETILFVDSSTLATLNSFSISLWGPLHDAFSQGV